jgi:hypothetical protein
MTPRWLGRETESAVSDMTGDRDTPTADTTAGTMTTTATAYLVDGLATTAMDTDKIGSPRHDVWLSASGLSEKDEIEEVHDSFPS